MLKRLLLKEVPSPLEGDTQPVPLYEAIMTMFVPSLLIVSATITILL